jgi:dTDP-4-amino-4,6-dideoxygalactose transaminase
LKPTVKIKIEKKKYKIKMNKMSLEDPIQFLVHNKLDLPTTEMLHDEVISLPISPTLKKKEIDCIINACNDFK